MCQCQLWQVILSIADGWCGWVAEKIIITMSKNDNNCKFDIKVVNDEFEAALHQDDDIHLIHYLESFEELNK